MRIEKQLEKFENMPFPHSALVAMFAGYERPNDKISLLVKSGVIIRIKKGLYVLSSDYRHKQISMPMLANIILGPSYVSLDYALSYHGLIPEGVYEISSVTIKRSKQFVTPLGVFSYLQTKADLYNIGITQQQTSDKKNYLMASPEKALCDKIINVKNIRLNSIKLMEEFLIEDIRVDIDLLGELDISVVSECVEVGYKREALVMLQKVIEKQK